MRTLTLFDAAFIAPKFEPDAAAYIAAVEAHDGQTLESGVKAAFNNFFVTAKANTPLWAALDTYIPMIGARTLAGSLVPAKGIAPTNVGLVSGDYSRSAGLKGNGTSKYLNTNRNSNFYSQDSFHMAAMVTTAPTITSAIMGARQTNDAGSSQIIHNNASASSFRLRSTAATADTVGIGTGLAGASRTSSTTGNWRQSGNRTGTLTQTSETPVSIDIHVFQRSGSSGNVPTDARIAGYTLGNALDLAAIETLLNTVRTDIAAALL